MLLAYEFVNEPLVESLAKIPYVEAEPSPA